MNYKLYLSILPIFISCILGVISYKKLSLALRLVFYIVLFAFITEITGMYFSYLFKNNLWVFYIANPIAFILFAIFYASIINSKSAKVVCKFLIICFALVCILNMLIIEDGFKSLFYFIILKGVLITILTLWYLYSIINDEKFAKPNLPLLLITISILFYYSFSAVYFSVINFLEIKQSVVAQQLKPYLYITNILLYANISIAFFITAKKNVHK